MAWPGMVRPLDPDPFYQFVNILPLPGAIADDRTIANNLKQIAFETRRPRIYGNILIHFGVVRYFRVATLAYIRLYFDLAGEHTREAMRMTIFN